jgi:vacuolar protein sorting-associated protein 35
LKSYGKILALLPIQERRIVSLNLIQQFTRSETSISTPEEVIVFLEYISPLLRRDLKDEKFNEEEWHDDQVQVACAINMFYSRDVDQLYPILQKAKEFLTGEVNISPLYTLVPLSFKALSLVQTIYKNNQSDSSWERKAKVVLKYVNGAISVIKNIDAMIAFNLYLQATLQAARCGLGEFANGFLTQGAFVLFEDEQVIQSKQQFNALRQLIAVVQSLTCFDQELYPKLAIHITEQLTPKLIVHDFQSKATALSAYLFATPHFKDVRNAQSCLKTAVTVATNIVEVEILANLLVILLDHYIYFFDKHPDIIDAKYVNAVISKIQKHSSSNSIEKSHPSQLYFRNVASFVVSKQNWESYTKKEKSKKDKDQIELTSDSTMSEKDARFEAERWKEISFTN